MQVDGCLFCNREGPFTTVEHIIPESLGNDDLTLVGEVCDTCQAYFGKEVERYVLSKTPIAVWRVLLSTRSKKGRLPSVDLSTTSKGNRVLPEHSAHHDQHVGFTAHEDGSISVDIDDDEIIREIASGTKTDFRFVLSPKHLVQIGRFLGKIGLELIAAHDRQWARSATFEQMRQYSRFGTQSDIWPLFHAIVGSISDVRNYKFDDAGAQVEEVVCFEYNLIDIASQYVLFSFRIGTDRWVICMDDPYPRRTSGKHFPARA